MNLLSLEFDDIFLRHIAHTVEELQKFIRTSNRIGCLGIKYRMLVELETVSSYNAILDVKSE